MFLSERSVIEGSLLKIRLENVLQKEVGRKLGVDR